jgi:hypothetical protein
MSTAITIHEPGYPANQPPEDAPAKLVGPTVFLGVRNKLAAIKSARSSLAEEERAATKEFKAQGGHVWALRVCRQIDAMDPDDRSDAIHSLDSYLTFLRYW